MSCAAPLSAHAIACARTAHAPRAAAVWSQEAFCHCMDHEALMAEVQRVLKPGGTVVFSDIMQSDNGGDCSSFTGQNVTTKLASPQTYKARCSAWWRTADATASFLRLRACAPHMSMRMLRTPHRKRSPPNRRSQHRFHGI